jgi:hypothetical protein
MSIFAKIETNLRKERQAERIAKAKAAGVYKAPDDVKALPWLGTALQTAARPTPWPVKSPSLRRAAFRTS